MFRPMRIIKQQIPEEECIRILKEEPRGVLCSASAGHAASFSARTFLTPRGYFLRTQKPTAFLCPLFFRLYKP